MATPNLVYPQILAGSLRESRFAWPQPQEEGDARQMILLEEKDLKVNSVSFMHGLFTLS
jgi:hypothetical protein